MTFRVLDPTAGEGRRRSASSRRAWPRCEGKTVGFISNGKEGTKGFFAHLERMLREELWRRQGREPHQVELQRAGRRPHRRRDQAVARRDLRHRRLRQLLIVQSARRRYG